MPGGRHEPHDETLQHALATFANYPCRPCGKNTF